MAGFFNASITNEKGERKKNKNNGREGGKKKGFDAKSREIYYIPNLRRSGGGVGGVAVRASVRRSENGKTENVETGATLIIREPIGNERKEGMNDFLALR